MNDPTVQRLKNSLKSISKETGVSFNRLLKETFLQRFIVRIAYSPYKENLIFKGGLCLKQYLELDRGTKDLDFLLQKIQVDANVIENLFREIAKLNINDSFQFQLTHVQLLEDSNKQYPGYRILLVGRCGNMKEQIQIDLGIDDVVNTKTRMILLLTAHKPIFEASEVELKVYPLEYIFSEKLQTILFRAEFNSRMKDFYDVYKILLSGYLNLEKTRNAIISTFNHRKTSIQIIQMDTTLLEKNWKRFISKEGLSEPDLTTIVSYIN